MDGSGTGIEARAALVRDRVPLSAVVGQSVALKRSGKGEFKGLCPFHNERTPSFTVSDGKGFFHCFGCGAHGDAIGYVMRQYGLKFFPALEVLERDHGLAGLKPSPQDMERARQRELVRRQEEAREAELKHRAARAVFAATSPLERDGLVDRYLRGRALIPPHEGGNNAGWPDDLRQHDCLPHDFLGKAFPAMVAPIRTIADGAIVGVHRTYLQARANGDVTAIDAPDKGWRKLTLGRYAGYAAAIRLGPEDWRMGVAEGIETALSAGQLYGIPTWSAVSSGNMPAMDLPFACGEVIFFADNDRNRIGVRRAYEACARQRKLGRQARVAAPAAHGDYNDVLRATRLGWQPGAVPTAGATA